ncbi:unnamed protein product [Lupinus luteus]|uniref:Uncharacterized protein n=1 Tax=Lupinus luteus TaxID=3873 RepID=A0AAV1XPE2_LUPLU
MASSSKKQRTNASQRSQGTTHLDSNPLDLARLLANDEQCKIFEEHFHGRTLFTPKYGNIVKRRSAHSLCVRSSARGLMILYGIRIQCGDRLLVHNKTSKS